MDFSVKEHDNVQNIAKAPGYFKLILERFKKTIANPNSPKLWLLFKGLGNK